ncbi:MAG: transcription termination/antitermination protein NusG [Planctomycetota bacterium]
MIEMLGTYYSSGESDEIEESMASGDPMVDEAAEDAAAEDAAAEDEAAEDEAVEDEAVEEDQVKAPRVRKGAAAELPFEWYVIKVANGREDTLSRKVEKTLSLRGLDDRVRNIVVPKQKVSEIKDGKKKIREVKLYQGYFFMECQLVEEIWYLLRDIQGVGSFVGGGLGEKPMPMTPDEVRKLRDMIEQRESEAAPELKIDVKKNDTVKVKDGPFENFEGIVEEVHPKTGKLRVMVTIFGRETPVDLEYWQVEQT